ncbi:MAG: MFS transporter [Mesorhizobium sp.]|uniref:MFS transporter n=1 Tax=Mesorhizobium sp. TaxID=1871066 RepID=UPI000FEA215B|nr:MFS transporter [Mesorhizobium sp.]RWI57081.1 MAG: MFS transporter [Mesorhizobium sp.]
MNTPSTTDALERRVAKRLLLFLMPATFIAIADRINISFVAPTMNPAIGIDAATFGFGAGIFFLGYMLFEVPSNLILARVGARYWISRIMISWGLVAAAMAFVSGPTSFVTMRFLLGVAEAGFNPGVLLFASYWISTKRFASFTSWLLSSVPVAGFLTALASGVILRMDGALGLAGWQWVFIIQALPAIGLGVFALFYLDDHPSSARWLSDREKQQIEEMASPRDRTLHVPARTSLALAMANPVIWVIAAAYLLMNLALGAQPWFPLMLGQTSLPAAYVPFVVAVPNLLAAIGMILWAKRSDRRGERKYHLLIAASLSAVGWFLCGFGEGFLAIVLTGITLALVGLYASVVVFWAIPPSIMTVEARPAGIGLITCIGLLGSFFSPSLTGFLRTATGSYSGGMYFAAGGILLAALLVKFAVSLPQDRTVDAELSVSASRP